MNNNLLHNELLRLQNEYKSLLNCILNLDTGEIVPSAIDEINIFWYKKKKIVHCILSNLFTNNDTFVFTAATYMDIDDMEHYPFVALGKYHILDDPLCKYAKLMRKIKDTVIENGLKEQLIETIKDNIKILDKLEDIIFILPISNAFEGETQLFADAGLQLFLSLFKKKVTYNEYINTDSTIEDLASNLRCEVERNIYFSDDDDMSLNIIERFYQYKSDSRIPMPKSMSDAEVFFITIYGYMIQAISILIICAEYNFIPYIRSETAFKYLVLTCDGTFGIKNYNVLITKSSIAHVLHRIFNKDQFKELEFITYYTKLREYQFADKVMTNIEIENLDIKNQSLNKIADLLSNSFNECFK